MAITSTQTAGQERVQMASGAYLDDAATPAAANIVIGFLPRYIEIVNETDRITFEWYEGMAATNTIKTVAAGTRTLDTTTAIAPGTDNRSIDIAAATLIQNKQYRWRAIS